MSEDTVEADYLVTVIESVLGEARVSSLNGPIGSPSEARAAAWLTFILPFLQCSFPSITLICSRRFYFRSPDPFSTLRTLWKRKQRTTKTEKMIEGELPSNFCAQSCKD
jgi:hypothetical protein